MIFGTVAARDIADAVLAHGIVIAGVRWAKGRYLTAADAAAAHAAGVAGMVVARLEAGDVAEDAAAAALAARLAGTNIAAAPAAHGRANLVATADGLVAADPAAVDAVNSVDEGITVGTLAATTRVAAGDVVATIKIIPFAVASAALAMAIDGAVPIAIAAFRPRRFVLIQTLLDGTSAKMLARTEAVTRARVVALGGTLEATTDCAHETLALAAALAVAPADAIILVAGASATADRSDVIPAAIVAAGGHVERLGMPVDPGNLLCLGALGGRAVIGLPGCARSPKRNGFDLVIERLAAGLAVNSDDIARMGAGGLLPEAERPQPRVAARPHVGAIVLAAGRSSRMAGANKLLADLDGIPVIGHTLDALAAAGLPPPVVVTGHMAGEVAAAIGARPATLVVAADFADGMSRSLAAGLAGAPAEWHAALIVLGDMPRVAPATLAAIAAAAADADAVVVPVADGRRGNPVAWGRAHWPRLMALTGDTGARTLLDWVTVTTVAVDDEGIFADVDTPEALAALRSAL